MTTGPQIPADLGSRVSVLEESVASIHRDVGEIKKAVGSRGLNWSAISVAALLGVSCVGGVYTLQNKENERIYSDIAHEHADFQAFTKRYDEKINRLDEIDKESVIDRASTKESLREVETQFRLGREIQELSDQLEASRRDLAIERAMKKQSQAPDDTPVQQIQDELRRLRGYVYSHHQREK